MAWRNLILTILILLALCSSAFAVTKVDVVDFLPMRAL